MTACDPGCRGWAHFNVGEEREMWGNGDHGDSTHEWPVPDEFKNGEWDWS